MRGIVVVPDKPTKQIFIFSDPKGNQLTFFEYGAEKHFKEMRIPTSLINESKIVHISSSGDYRFNIRLANAARSQGIPVAFDVGNNPFTENPEYLKGMVPCVTFLFASTVEVPGVLDNLEVEKTIELLDYGPSCVVVINKKDRSSTIYTKASIEEIPPITGQTVKDPTGATDGYVTGFLAGYLKGYDMKIAGRLGAVEASFISEHIGCQAKMPSWTDLIYRLKSVLGIAL